MDFGLALPSEQGLLQELDIDSIESIPAPKSHLKQVFPLDEGLSSLIHQSALTELSDKGLSTSHNAKSL